MSALTFTTLQEPLRFILAGGTGTLFIVSLIVLRIYLVRSKFQSSFCSSCHGHFITGDRGGWGKAEISKQICPGVVYHEFKSILHLSKDWKLSELPFVVIMHAVYIVAKVNIIMRFSTECNLLVIHTNYTRWLSDWAMADLHTKITVEVKT